MKGTTKYLRILDVPANIRTGKNKDKVVPVLN
jgi:hypothetical protein